MKKGRLKALLLALIVIALMVPFSAAHAEVRHTTIPDKVIVEAQGAYRGYFPSVAAAANGDLVLVYYWSDSHAGGNGSIMMKRSTDGGLTWSGAALVVDTAIDDRDPSITALNDGTLLVSWFTYQNQSPVDVKVIRSADNGTTWGGMATVGTNMPWAATSSSIIELSNGDLSIILYGPSPTQYQQSTAVRSTDKGLTWPASSEKVVGYIDGIHLVEPAFAELEPGHLKALLRASSDDNLAYEAHSYDYGMTWGAPVKLGEKMHAPELFRIPGTNKVFHAWSDFQNAGGGRPVVVRMGYLDRPWSFAETRVLYANKETSDMGYSSTVMLDSERLFTVYYDAKKQIIGGTFSKVGNWEADYGAKIDLLGMYAEEELTVSSDMNYIDPNNAATGLRGPLDGSIGYGNAAFKSSAAPAYYTIDLKKNVTVGAIGVLLKAGYAESAVVQVSSDGINWQDVQSYQMAVMNQVDYTYFDEGREMRYVKVNVTESSGWAGLNEIQLFEYRPYGKHKLPLLSMLHNNQISVSADTYWLNPGHPETGINGPLDGSTDYWHSAFKDGGSPAYYIVDLKQEVPISTIGVSLVPGYITSAQLSLSTDGIQWGKPINTYSWKDANGLRYNHLAPGTKARYVKVEIAVSSGLAGLNELEIYTDNVPQQAEEASISAMLERLDGYEASANIKATFASDLRYRLTIIELLLDQGAKQQAIAYMQDFLLHMNDLSVLAQNLISEAAAGTLSSDANSLITKWSISEG